MNDGNGPLKPLKWYRKLATGKGRREAGAFLVEGERAIRQITGLHPESVREILAVDEVPAFVRGFPAHTVTEKQFRAVTTTRTPQGIMAVVRIPGDSDGGALPGNTGNRILLLEDIQDPGNVGTLLRTAAAFDFSGAILTGKCADPFAPKCVQASAGSVLSLWLRRTAGYLELVETLKKEGFTVVAADLGGKEDTAVLHHREKLLLALGNEASGLSAAVLDKSDYRLRIPTASASAESLNVAACGAICMYMASW